MAKILIVDDSATSRSIAALMIGDAHALTEASSGQEALDRMSAESFDIVLLDLLMPGMGGFEVLGLLAARGSRVPVIIATADIQNSTRAHAKALGASALINKPLMRRSLEAAIAAALGATALGEAALGEAASVPSLEPSIKAAFQEMMAAALEKAAAVLNTMLSSSIVLTVPAIEAINSRDLSARFSKQGAGKLSAIEMRCAGGFDASIELIFTSEDAGKLADCVLGAGAERDSQRSGALCEIGNIVINAVLGTISNTLDVDLSFTVPSYLEGSASALVDELTLPKLGIIILVQTMFEVKDLCIDGDIALFLTLKSFESLSARLREKEGRP